MINEMKKLLKITGSGLLFIILLILRSPVDLAMTAMHAEFLRHAFNAIEQNSTSRLYAVCIAFGIASFCLFMYNGSVWSIYAPFTVGLEGKLRIKLFDKISRFSYSAIEAVSHGEWLTRLNTDVQMPFNQPIHLPHAVNAIIRIIVSGAILWIMNPPILGLVMVFVIPHIVLSQVFAARAMPRLNKESLEAAAKNTDDLNALITCAEAAALYDGQKYLMGKFEQSSLNLLRTKMRMVKRSALGSTAALPLFGMGGYLILLIVSSAWIAEGSFTFGGLTAAFQYRGGVLLGSLMLINCMISIKASMAGIGRINETMYQQTEEING